MSSQAFVQASAQDDKLAVQQPPLPEQLKQLIVLYFRYNSAQELEPLLELMADDLAWNYPSSKGTTKASYARHVSKTFKLASLFIAHHAVEPEQIVVEGDKAIARWRFQYQIRYCGCGGKPWRKQGFNTYEFDTSTPDRPLIKSVRTEVVK